MVDFRIQLSPQESAFYETLFMLAGPDTNGQISGSSGAQFLATSGLPRDTLHKIWSLADVHQQGKLDKDGFSVACRMVAHRQSGSEPDESLLSREPTKLPVFGGRTGNVQPKDFDVISVSDIGNEGRAVPNMADTARASNIAMSLRKLGLDPLEYIPFQSVAEVPNSSSPKSADWKITEVDRQKYLGLFKQLHKSGFVDGVTARKLLEKSGLNRQILGVIWELSDMNLDGRLDETEFVIAMHFASKCKKGSLLPNDIPQELREQLIVDTPMDKARSDYSFQPRRTTASAVPEWKYSRTYLGDNRTVDDIIRGDVDQTEEEMRHIHDTCAQVERDIARMKAQLELQKSIISELNREKQILTETKQTVSETRRKVNIGKVSLSRDRAKLQSEIAHLNKLLRDGSKEVEILRSTVKEAEVDVDRVVTQTKTLNTQRREANMQHREEMDKIEAEQKETAGLVDSFTRLSREEEIKLESERITAEKQKIIQRMQQSPKDDYVQYKPAAAQGTKWATTMLSSDVSPKNTTRFGTSFFQG
jgi:hypothetical protein